MVCVFPDHRVFKKQLSGRTDYGFHSYGELSEFVYCLLTQTRRVADMPVLSDWDAYMDSSKVAVLGKIYVKDFLANHPFGDALRRANTGEVRDVRSRCLDFMNHLVDAILSLHLVTGNFYQSIYCFCPEMLHEGDDRYIFGLFGKLLRVLEKVGCLSRDAVNASIDEFAAFVVEARFRHEESERSASAINDVVTYLLSDYGFLSRHNLVRVLQLCSLVVLKNPMRLPSIDIDLSDCSVPAVVLNSAIKCVQSYVRMPTFKQGSFFTVATMDAVRQSVMKAQDFMESTDFDLWAEIAQKDRSAFVGRYSDLFAAHLAQKKKNAETRLRSVPERPRDMRSGGSVVSGAGSAVASPVRSTVRVVSSTKKSRRELQTSLASYLGVKRGSTLPVVSGSKVADDAGEQSGSCSSKRQEFCAAHEERHR